MLPSRLQKTAIWYMELEKPLTGAFTIEGLTKKMDALRKAHHLL